MKDFAQFQREKRPGYGVLMQLAFYRGVSLIQLASDRGVILSGAAFQAKRRISFSTSPARQPDERNPDRRNSASASHPRRNFSCGMLDK